MKDDRLNNDKTLGSWLKELKSMEVFNAQIELENRILSSHRTALENLRLGDKDLELEYVRVRSTIDTIKMLQSARENLVENR